MSNAQKNYQSPRVTELVTVRLESCFLQGSVIGSQSAVDTAGHTVEKHDFDSGLPESGFNHSWE